MTSFFFLEICKYVITFSVHVDNHFSKVEFLAIENELEHFDGTDLLRIARSTLLDNF